MAAILKAISKSQPKKRPEGNRIQKTVVGYDNNNTKSPSAEMGKPIFSRIELRRRNTL